MINVIIVFNKMFKFYIKFIKTRRKLIICLIFLVVLYSLYISSNSWLIPKSVSNNENDAKNVMSLAKSRNSYLLPNLMHRQLVVNSSHIKTINTEKLISLLKTPLTQVLISYLILINGFDRYFI